MKSNNGQESVDEREEEADDDEVKMPVSNSQKLPVRRNSLPTSHINDSTQKGIGVAFYYLMMIPHFSSHVYL